MQGQDPEFTLLQAARIVARGSELDAKLDALCEQVLNAAGASAAIIYVFDPVQRMLVPAAQAGMDAGKLATDATISADDPEELVAQVVRERRMATGSTGSSRGLADQTDEGAGQIALPLIASDEAGGEDAEGVLLASFAGGVPDVAGPENALTALADLCAVAIRQARLENALLEKADWIGRLANTDPLTGLANRVTFERMLELEIARATRQETQLSVLLFDIDGFAGINERAGAQAADDILRHVAATLADQVRLVDTVARFGPDEFALIAPGGGGEVAGRRVRDALSSLEAGGEPVSLGVGAVVYPIDGATSDELLTAAAAALAEAKRRGRGSIVARSGPN
ncbi:MAG: GGDEF domain-containing protein [Chloroflexota bacterium]